MGRRARAQQREIANKQASATDEQLKVYKAEQVIQRKLLAEQKQEYRSFEFKNPYENLENYYEDLTVNTQAADYQKGMVQQQQANIMQGLKGSAGSSGIAGLAQAMANQGAMQAQQISIGIGQQEQQNQMMERQAASASNMAFRGGEASLQEMEMSRQATLLGIQMGQTSGANQAVQQSYANQMSAGANQANMYSQQAAGLYGLAGQQNQSASNMLTSYMMYES